MRVIVLIISALISCATLQAKTLQFSEEMWNFGTIAEDGGTVSHDFEITNKTGQPIVIYDVRSSCGCTTPKFSRKPIAKGETTTLTVTYDPLFRPGMFSKDVYIYSSASSQATIIKIKGDVTPRVLAVEERYPYTMDYGMRISTMFPSFRAVPHGRLVQQSVEIKNTSDKSNDLEFRPRHSDTPLQLHYERKIAAGEGATVDVGYYLEEGAGKLYDTVDIFINGKRSEKSLFINGLIVE